LPTQTVQTDDTSWHNGNDSFNLNLIGKKVNKKLNIVLF
jgi:hypothetical protein